MRIIAGEFRSRQLQAPPGSSTRPTSDRLRETLFNVLAPRIAGVSFLDLYAGSGAIGLEALSRGAERIVFVERAAGAVAMLRKNLAILGLTSGFRVHTGAVGAFLKKAASQADAFDLVFLDPPYDAAEEYAAALGLLGGEASALLQPGALVVAEHRRKQRLDPQYGRLTRTRLLQQGDAALSFFALSE